MRNKTNGTSFLLLTVIQRWKGAVKWKKIACGFEKQEFVYKLKNT